MARLLESLEMDRVSDVEVSPKAMSRDQPEQLRPEQYLRYPRVLVESAQLGIWIAGFVDARSQPIHRISTKPRQLDDGHPQGCLFQADKAIPQNAQNPAWPMPYPLLWCRLVASSLA